jgi:hypothetical protein
LILSLPLIDGAQQRFVFDEQNAVSHGRDLWGSQNNPNDHARRVTAKITRVRLTGLVSTGECLGHLRNSYRKASLRIRKGKLTGATSTAWNEFAADPGRRVC